MVLRTERESGRIDEWGLASNLLLFLLEGLALNAEGYVARGAALARDDVVVSAVADCHAFARLTREPPLVTGLRMG